MWVPAPLLQPGELKASAKQIAVSSDMPVGLAGFLRPLHHMGNLHCGQPPLGTLHPVL